jgi:4-hydroxy-3-methylbut-2-en-1-yl diphosphate reductase
MVQTAADLRPEWFAEAGTVGVTAGTSTPDAIIAAVERRLSEFAAAAARELVSHAQEESDHAPALAARAA